MTVPTQRTSRRLGLPLRFLQGGLAAASLLLVVASCGESTGPDSESSTVCPDLGAVVATGMPLDAFVLEGLPDDLEPTQAEVRSPETDATILTAVEPPVDGRVSVLVPLHPDLDPEGGRAELVVSSGSSSCEGVPITIEPLPMAPGEFERSITTFVGRIEDVLTAQGREVTDFYQDDLSGLPADLLPYAALHSLVAHPDRPESVLALATGATTSIDGDEVDMELLDRVAASIGMLEDMETIPLFMPPAGPPAPASGARRSPDRAEGPVLSCPNGDFGLAPVSDTDGLSDRMREQRAAEVFLQGARAKYLQDGATLLGIVVTAASEGAAAGFAEGLSTSVSASMTAADVVQHLLPGDLEPELFLSPTAFNEDDPGPGEWTLLAVATSEP